MTLERSWYSFDKVLSFNCTYNLIVSARGKGKTYGAKKLAIRGAVERGEQFIYLRRFKTDLQGRSTFFNDIAHEFPDHAFRVNGQTAEMTMHPVTKKSKWVIIGYFHQLSNAQSRKSSSYPDVRWIIFDEFIISRGYQHYLPSEVNAFNDYYSTIDRYRDQVRVLFLANSVTITNPYFLEYMILPVEGRQFYRFGNGFGVAHIDVAGAFGEEVRQTRFGQFIADTDYAKYAIDSQFDDNTQTMIGEKGATATYNCTIETPDGAFSVWLQLDTLEFFIQEKRPKVEKIWVTDPSLMSEGKNLMLYGHKTLQYLRGAFSGGRCWFDNARTRNTFITVFKR